MSVNWNELAQYAFGVTAITGLLAFLGKKGIEAFLSGRLEKHKAELQRAATEHSIRFQQLHTERAEVIRDLYSKVSTLDIAMKDALKAFHSAPEPALGTKVDAVRTALNSIIDFYPSRRIFLEEDLCSILDSLINESGSVYINITSHPVDPTSREY